MTRFLPYVSVGALLAGCGPSLEPAVRTTQAFGIAQRCSQGPFELHLPAFGSKWGEDVTLEARGSAIAGRSTLDVEGHHIDTDFSSGTVDSSACMLSDADRVASSSAGSTAPASTTNAPQGTADAAGTGTTSKATVQLLPAAIPSSWIYRTEIARYHNEVNDWASVSSILKRGQDVKIVFWSEHPIDLHATVFVLTHSEMLAPNNDDKKWQAHLDDVRTTKDKEQAEAAAKAKTEAAAAEVTANEKARCSAVQGVDKKCHDEGWKTATELLAYAELQRRCEALAKNNATDQACRDDGWRNANERPDVQPQLNANATVPQRPADRPPPAPREEVQSPKPSTNAEWIAGSWQWGGSDWVWLSGGWKVPDQDRTLRLTATAPTAPPAMRIEARPVQPIASAVWADGYWHYMAGQWVWVPGHWAVPPRTGATWRPSTWVQDGVQLRLDPGGWR
jgi:hypothetical protein